MMDKIYVSKSCTQQKLIYFFCHSLHRMQRHGNEKKALLVCLSQVQVDRGLKPVLVKPKTMKLVFVASPLSTQNKGVNTKSGLLESK